MISRVQAALESGGRLGLGWRAEGGRIVEVVVKAARDVPFPR